MEIFHTYFFTFSTMKSAMIVVLLAGLTLVSGVSAMTMTDDAMMKKDSAMTSETMDKSMKKDTMAKDDKMMMKDDAMMAKKSIASVAASMGYSWGKDRATLASKAGIVGYRGTAKQNGVIRAYLMGMMKDKMAMKDGAMMKDDKMMKDTMAK
jgi:hypothetical protein